MIILGATSDISQAFVDKFLTVGNKKYSKIYLITSNPGETERISKHLLVKHKQDSEIIKFDLIQDSDYSVFDTIESDLLFCAIGFLGKNTEKCSCYDCSSRFYGYKNDDRIGIAQSFNCYTTKSRRDNL